MVPVELYRELGDMKVAPLLTGMWQVGGGHGYRPEPRKVEADMRKYAAAGLNTFDRKSVHRRPAQELSTPLTSAPLNSRGPLRLVGGLGGQLLAVGRGEDAARSADALPHQMGAGAQSDERT